MPAGAAEAIRRTSTRAVARPRKSHPQKPDSPTKTLPKGNWQNSPSAIARYSSIWGVATAKREKLLAMVAATPAISSVPTPMPSAVKISMMPLSMTTVALPSSRRDAPSIARPAPKIVSPLESVRNSSYWCMRDAPLSSAFRLPMVSMRCEIAMRICGTSADELIRTTQTATAANTCARSRPPPASAR